MAPEYTVYAPGRVNLIGEHVDHQNYPVLPCAIDRCLKCQVKISNEGPSLTIEHEESDIYDSRIFETAEDIVIDSSKHHWTNYVLAAYIGLMEFYAEGVEKVGVARRQAPYTDLIAASDFAKLKFTLSFSLGVPQAAGLSSSSALVVASALAFSRGEIEKSILASICASAERHVGTAGGGMDQAAILLSEEGFAHLIEFQPLTLNRVSIPKGLSIVVSDSCKKAAKAESKGKHYNARAFELKVGSYLLLKKTGRMPEGFDIVQLLSLGLRETCRSHLKLEETQLLERLAELLPERLSKDELDSEVGIEIRQGLLDLRVGREVWDCNEEFFIRRRVRHVLTETLRVRSFVEASERNEIFTMGRLINESHKSLDQDFDCSCEELNDMCEIGRSAGALGIRLCGAGFGGCCVALMEDNKVEEYMKRVRA